MNKKEYSVELVSKLQIAWKYANESLNKYRNEMIKQYEKHQLNSRKPTNFEINDHVWMKKEKEYTKKFIS